MGALSDIKVLDFSTLVPGPMATMFLADMGADVVNIVAPGRHDMMNDFAPTITDLGISASSAWLGRNKRSMALNLKKHEAVEVIRKMIDEYDIVVEQFRPGTMKKMGLDYDSLKKINPNIIYVSLTGYGQYGPLAMCPGHDINYLAVSGNLIELGNDNATPGMPDFQVPDIAGGTYMSLIAILSALHYRDVTGKGQYLDVSIFDAMFPFCNIEGTAVLASKKYEGWNGKMISGLYLGPQYGFFKTKDRKYIALGALEPKFFKELCRGLGLDEWSNGEILYKRPEYVEKTLAEKFSAKTRDEWIEYFEDYDTCISPVLSMEESFEHEHVRVRDLVPEVPLSLCPEKTVQQLGLPIKMSETPAEYKHTAYPPGYHTLEILEELGYSEEDIKDLCKK